MNPTDEPQMSLGFDAKENAKDTDSPPPANLDTVVGKIASMMQPGQGFLGTGELAELRRISPEQPFTPSLWRILLSLNVDASETDERKWASLLMSMAICAGLHDYKTSLGKALAEAGWSDLRFAQLMKARGKALELQLRRVAQFLASKNQKANWADIRKLIFYQNGDWAEEHRIRIARNYYKTLYQNQK